MLKQRIVTAIILFGILVGSFLYLPTTALGGVLGIFALIGIWEWAGLSGIPKVIPRLLYVLGAAVLGAFLFVAVREQYLSITHILGLAIGWWIIALISLITGNALFASVTTRILSGYIVLIPAWIGPVYLHSLGEDYFWVLLYLVVLVGTADTFAYFSGRKWGRTKLAPDVSPGKSIEGMVGGLIAVLVLAVITGPTILGFRQGVLLVFVAISFVTALASVLGDLVESKVKRIAGVKDSGNLLPGHGGVLDRIDAFTAAAPVYSLAWIYGLSGST
ncbi:MAG: phosphatidate cytidylyltransferase [Gammaproteobacteria bacterium]|nr:MAG: phosphatidate cytidylyltransferase [Gammaproteobacteria bacterium]